MTGAAGSGDGSRRWGRLLLYIAVGLFLLLFAGKLLRLPVAAIVVTGTSMVPALRPGDVILGVKPSLSGGVDVGDIAVYCLGVALRTSCVVHRVVGIQQTPGGVFVVMRGDAVPRSDPPVPASAVDYVVAARAPREALLVAAALAAAYVLHRYYLRILRLVHSASVFLEPGLPALTMTAALLAANLLYVGAGYVDATAFTATLPGVEEHVTVNLTAFTVGVRVGFEEPLAPRGEPSCRLRGYGAAPVAHVEAGGDALSYTVVLPGEAFREAWLRLAQRKPPLTSYPASIAETMFLDCRVVFNYAVLRSSYPIRFQWREPAFAVTDGSVVVVNPNPAPLNITMVVYRPPGYGIVAKRVLTVPPFTRLHVEPPAGSGFLIRFFYDFAGHRRVYTLRLAGG